VLPESRLTPHWKKLRPSFWHASGNENPDRRVPSSRIEGNTGCARPRVRNGASCRLWVEEEG
jgi:hypothetical protein